MEIGTRIYYTGDMANDDGFGEIACINPDKTVDVRLDDGREFRHLFAAHFAPGPGLRFRLESEWRAERERFAAALAEKMKSANAGSNLRR